MEKFADPAAANCVPATYSLKPADGGAAVNLSIREERFLAPECYFQPKLADLDVEPLHALVDEAVLQCPIDARRKLYNSICLSVRGPPASPLPTV